VTTTRTRTGGRLMAALGAAALVVVLAPAARAGETDTFRFEPWPVQVQGHERRTFAFDAAPGETVTDAVRLTNTTDTQRTFRVYAAAAHQDAAGNITPDPYRPDPQSAGAWIAVDGGDELQIDAHDAAVVTFRVRRPADQPAEGLAAVVAEELAEPSAGAGIQVVYRIAIVVRFGGEATGLEVGRPVVDLPLALMPSAGEVAVMLTNTTLEPVTATLALEVDGLTGTRWSLDPVQAELNAGESREVRVPWTSVPRWGGLLRATAAITWERGTIEVAGARRPHPPLWLVALCILAVGVRAGRELRRRRTAVVLPVAPDRELVGAGR
jgi:GTPase